jgi:predicted DNA-binding transcriptional regulator AlpA
MKKKARRRLRLLVKPDSILSEEEVAYCLPGPADGSIRTWIRTNVEPFGQVASVTCYRWGDVLTQVAKQKTERPAPARKGWLTTAQVATRLGINRSTLDEMIAAAPSTLAGSPRQVGTGSKRRHLRWDEAQLDAWLEAYRAWAALPQKVEQPAPQHREESSKTPAPKAKRRQRSLLSVVSN